MLCEMSEERSFRVEVDRDEGFVFRADFGLDGVEPLAMDEPEPLGAESGPNASKVLAAAVGNCLSASLLFCLQKSRVPVKGLRANVAGELARNEKGRMRIRTVKVTLHPALDGVPPDRMARCVELFEDFCVVTQSVRSGVEVDVDVEVDAPVEVDASPVGAGA